jgi:hypothetical protein
LSGVHRAPFWKRTFALDIAAANLAQAHTKEQISDLLRKQMKVYRRPFIAMAWCTTPTGILQRVDEGHRAPGGGALVSTSGVRTKHKRRMRFGDDLRTLVRERAQQNDSSQLLSSN